MFLSVNKGKPQIGKYKSNKNVPKCDRFVTDSVRFGRD